MGYTRMGIKYTLVTLVLAALQLTTFSLPSEAKTADTLLTDVLSLKLGMNGYVIGKKLGSARKKIAGQHPVAGAYEGTYKFRDNDLYVVVDKKTDRVLALYKQRKNAGKNQLKTMVVELMDRFDAPTTMAHDKILYWAFNRHGAISEDDFNQAKKIQQTSELGIIATVKLNSEIEITPDPDEKEKGAVEKKEPSVGTIYFIISSAPLTREFIAAHQE